MQLRSRGLVMSGVAIANETPKPVSMRDKKEKWHAASTQRDRVGVKGGYNTKAEAAAALEYQVDGATHVYVELDKNAQWFLKGVGGPKARKGDLKAVKVLDLITPKGDQRAARTGRRGRGPCRSRGGIRPIRSRGHGR